MRVPRPFFLSLLALLLQSSSTSLAAAAEQTTVILHITASPSLPNPRDLPPSTHATLSTLRSHPPGLPSALLTPANTLVFRNVTAGSYLLDVHCATHAFAPLRVDVDPGDAAVSAWETFRGNDWDNRGEAVPLVELQGEQQSGVGPYRVFQIRAVAAKRHFIERPKFSVLSILKNPMILVAIFGLAVFMGMPYLMEKMDPEMRAEFEEAQKNGPMGSLLGGGGSQGGSGGFDLASMLAGSGSGENTSGQAGGGEPKKKKDKKRAGK